MAQSTIEDRINYIIAKQKISKTEFAERVGISRNYVYILTGVAKRKIKTVSHTLAKLIEKEFGYPAEWVLTGEVPRDKLSKEMSQKMLSLDEETLRLVAAYLESLEKGL